MGSKIAHGYRIDRVIVDDEDLLPPTEGPGGSLLVEGIVARPGIYLYPQGDGSVRRELVRRDDLWNEDSIGTLGRASVTIEHPPEMLTPDNVRTYAHGDSDGEIVQTKKGYVKIRMALRTREAQDAAPVKRQLSPGYKVDTLEEPGVDPEFGAYDAIQLKRVYNHIAMTGRARGGGEMSYRTDSDDLPVMVGGPKEIYTMLTSQIAAQFAARYDSAKTLVQKFLTDSLVEDFEKAKALQEFWNDFWTVNDTIRCAIDNAFKEEKPKDVQAALNAVAADLPELLKELASKFDETVDVVKERYDAASPPPAKKPEPDPNAPKPDAPPAADPNAAKPPADGAPAPAAKQEGAAAPTEGAKPDAQAPPTPPGDPNAVAPTEKPEGGGAPQPADGTVPPSADPNVPGSEGDPAVPTPDVAPPAGAGITAQQLQESFDLFKANLQEMLAPLLALIPQSTEMPGARIDSRLDGYLASGMNYQILRTRFDSLARDLGIGYDPAINIADLARTLVGKLRPEIKFDSDADYVAAAQVLQAPKAATIERKDATEILLPAPVKSIYGPQNAG